MLRPSDPLILQKTLISNIEGSFDINLPTPLPSSSTSLSPKASSSLYDCTFSSARRRPLILDPLPTVLNAETPIELGYRRFKTTQRGMYDAAARRGAQRLSTSESSASSAQPTATQPSQIPPEVLLHTDQGVLLETCTSNIALWLPRRSHANADANAKGGPQIDLGVDAADSTGEWITPLLCPPLSTISNSRSLDSGDEEIAADEAVAVFLDGVVRQELLSRGMIKEGVVTIDDFELCKRVKRPVVGFNGLR